MRKLFYSLLVLILILDISLISLAISKKTSYDYYTIIQAKGFTYSDSSKMSFEIYTKDSNPDFIETNIFDYYITSDDYQSFLTNVKFTKGNEVFIMYCDTINPNNNELVISNAHLTIKGQTKKYDFNLGYISIIDANNYKLLNFDDLFMSYAYNLNQLLLAGVNIKLSKNYKCLNYLNVASIAFSDNELIIEDKYMPNEINGEVQLKKSRKEVDYNLNSNMLYIPLGYEVLSLIRKSYILISLDNELYYIDSFDFINNIPTLKDYPNYVRAGVISDWG